MAEEQEKLSRKERAELKEQAKQEKHDAKKTGAKNVCRFGIIQALISFLVLIVFVISWLCLHSKDPQPWFYKTIVVWVMGLWLVAEIFISLFMWFYSSRLVKKWDDKGEKLRGAKMSLNLNRAYVIGGAIPTAITLVVLGIISLFK
ncbi:MAG TPA: hypothetical protein DEO39_02590 [Clostridiales bacterium]|nr:hypothetical protein [Clostridiales bacterium]HBZ77577.1 hypothetical protein [Clostridiales bacterium]